MGSPLECLEIAGLIGQDESGQIIQSLPGERDPCRKHVRVVHIIWPPVSYNAYTYETMCREIKGGCCCKRSR